MMGKAARIRALRSPSLAADPAGPVAFPPVAAKQIVAFNGQAQQLQQVIQNYVIGVLTGLGVDVENQRIDVDYAAGTYTVRAKDAPAAEPPPETP